MTDTAIHKELLPMLSRVGLFSRCSTYELKIVAAKATLRSTAAGDVVIHQGDEGNELFVVLEGAAEARIDGRVRNQFGPGDYFGEIAVLVPAPRTADVVATAPSVFAVIERNQLVLLLEGVPGIARKLLEGLATSLRDQIAAQ